MSLFGREIKRERERERGRERETEREDKMVVDDNKNVFIGG